MRRKPYRRWHSRYVFKLFVVPFAVLLSAVSLSGNAQAERVFGEDVLVSGEPVGVDLHRSRCSGQHSIAALGDSLFVVWYGEGSEGHGTYLGRSLDGGGTFEAPARVDDGGVLAYGASVDVDRFGNVYVVWCDRRDGDGPGENIYFSKSTDGGETFGSDVRVDDAGDDSSDQEWPAVAVDDSGRIYVVWLDERGNGGSGVYFSRSQDGGQSFEPSIALPNANDNPPLGVWPQFGPSIAAAGDGRVYVSYVDVRHVDNGGDRFVVARHSMDYGETFSEAVDIASYIVIPMHTSIATGGSLEVYVAWVLSEDYPFVARSDDGGQTFWPGVQVTDRAACCSQDYMCISISTNASGWVAVAWKDSFNTLGFAESRDRGMSFLPTVLLAGSGDRGYATVAIDEEHSVYIAWTDYRHSTKGDIYFAKGVLDPPAGIGDAALDGSSQRLIRVKPNPFSSHITVEYRDDDGPVSLGIYDLCGRLVRRLYGHGGTVEWDGLDDGGRRVAPGVYFINSSGEPVGGSVKLILRR